MKTLQTQWFPNQFAVQVRRPTGWGWEGPRAPVPRPRVCLGEGAFVGPGGGGPPRRGVCPELPDCGPELSHSPFRSMPASSRPLGPGVCQNLSRGHGRRPPPPLAERPWQFPWVTGLCTQWRAQGAAPAGPLLALLSVFSSLSYPHRRRGGRASCRRQAGLRVSVWATPPAAQRRLRRQVQRPVGPAGSGPRVRPRPPGSASRRTVGVSPPGAAL